MDWIASTAAFGGIAPDYFLNFLPASAMRKVKQKRLISVVYADLVDCHRQIEKKMTRVDRDKEKFAGNVPDSRLLVSVNWKIRYSADNETFKVQLKSGTIIKAIW